MTWIWTVVLVLSLALVVRGADDKAKKPIINELSVDLSTKLDSYLSTIHPIDVKFVSSEGNAKGVKWTVVTPSNDILQVLMEMQGLMDVEHSVSADSLKEMMKAADKEKDGLLSMDDLAKYIAQRGLNKESISAKYNQDMATMSQLIYKFGPIHAGEFTRLYTFCHQNFYRQVVDHLCTAGEGRFYEQASYKDLAALIKTSDILSDDGKDYSTARIKSCMDKVLSKCKSGECKMKRGFFRTLKDIIKAPFLSSFSSSVAIFRFNRSGQNA